MALGVGITVSPHVNQTFSSPPQAQPPIFGVITAGAGPYDVLWSDGRVQSAIPGPALDEIADVANDVFTAFNDEVVRPTGVSSSRFDAEVVQLYTRNPGGGAAGKPTALVKGINTSTWRERFTETLEIAPGL